MLIEEKMDAIRARFEISPRKTLQRLTQETIVPKASARRTTKIATIATIKRNFSLGFEGTWSGFKNILLKNQDTSGTRFQQFPEKACRQ
jgi:hypothetical protein